MNSCEEAVPCSSSNTDNLDEQDFPALPKSQPLAPAKKIDVVLPPYHSKITEILEIPSEERRFLNQETDLSNSKRKCDAHKKICTDVARDIGVEINLSTNKSNLLAIIISGEPSKVHQAKRLIAAELQQQETIKLNVPSQYHGYLIGRKGDRLRELQASTMTRINIPSPNSSEPNIITITGPKRGIAEAEQKISMLIQQQVEQGFERLNIPKIYHPFICGPSNRTINELMERTGTKINVPPPLVPATDITIAGKREGVIEAAREIQAIYEERAESIKPMPVIVKRSQHRHVLGQRGSGIAEILASTGVSVELPTNNTSEEIILRGRPEDLGMALSMVYQKAESSVTEEISAPSRFYKLLIGKRGSTLSELREGYERVRIDFSDKTDKITVEGPLEEVEIVVDRLKKRLAELEATMAMETVKVDPKYYRHIIGKQGATILRLCEKNVRITLPSHERGDMLPSDEIIIEGDPEGVMHAKAEIEKLVGKLENEKCKDIIIEPRVQRLLCTSFNGAPQPIRAIYDNFPRVSILWPDNNSNSGGASDTAGFCDDPSKSVVQLRGDRQQVDAASEKLQKLIKTVLEENHRQEIRIVKEFRPHIFGRESTKIRKLLDDTKTRIQYPSPTEDADVYTIIGREENVRSAIQQLEEWQKQLANVKEVIISIPSQLTTKFAGDQAPSLRSIREQCDGVHMRLLNPNQKGQSNNSKQAARKTNQVEVLVIGPAEAVNKAQKLLDQLNAKVSELCAEEILQVNPRFHGFLIGRQGSNITRFRERHNVELLFPDRMESNPELAKEIRIVGPKAAVNAARKELESMVKALEDEVEETVEIDANLIKDFNRYRYAFSYPYLDRVRIMLPPKSTSSRSSADQPNNGNNIPGNHQTIPIKLVGQKACIESATQALKELITDIQEQTSQEFPIYDVGHASALERSRPLFPELQRNHRVFIRLLRPTDPASFDGTNSDDGAQTSSPANAMDWFCMLIISGRPDRIQQVYEDEIKPLLPVDEVFPLSHEFHRCLFFVQRNEPQPQQQQPASTNQIRKPLREKQKQQQQQQQAPTQDTDAAQPNASESVSKIVELKQKHGVTVRIPPQNATDSNFVNLYGTPHQVAAAKADLTEWLKLCEAQKADRLARNYEESFEAPTRFVQTLMSLRPKLSSKYDIVMRVLPKPPVEKPVTELLNGNSSDHETAGPNESQAVPNGDVKHHEDEQNHDSHDKDGEEEDGHVNSKVSTKPTEPVKESMTTILLRGYQDKVAESRAELDKMVAKLNAQVTESLYIPVKVHPHLIGSHGNAIQKTMRDFNVRIEFPSRNPTNGTDPNTVLVSGDEKDVDAACDHLIGKANDLIMRLESRPSRAEGFEDSILVSDDRFGSLRA